MRAQCTPRPASFATDADLVGYCDLHCRTEVALFHRSQVARICALAGVELDAHWPVWASVRAETMLPLVAKARDRLRSLNDAAVAA